MKRAATVAYWVIPPLFCLIVYWDGLNAWFHADDFAWLGLSRNVHTWRDFLHAMFAPMAQGTLRPWSERAFFMGFETLFGLDALPFRIFVFLTQFVNLALVSSITQRLMRSRAAGFCAPLLWLANSALAGVMAWTSAYNQALCGLFMLAAFHFLLRHIETGKRVFYVLQWTAFLLGFGALELNVVYPVLAATYTLLCARKYVRNTLPFFLVSAGYAIVHRIAAPNMGAGPYRMYLDGSILHTLWTYWTWSLGSRLRLVTEAPVWVGAVTVAALTLALLGFAAARALSRQWLPLFLLQWFGVMLLPVLPLREHISDYYLFLPTIGLAMLGAHALLNAWRKGTLLRVLSGTLLIAYLAVSLPVARAFTRLRYQASEDVRRLVLGVESAAQLHPAKVILLSGVSEDLFWGAMFHHAFALVGASQVFLTPGSEHMILPHVELGSASDFVLPPGPTLLGLERGDIVVYAAGGERLQNVTTQYKAVAQAELRSEPPRRLDLGSPLAEPWIGSTWYALEGGNHRWMPKRAAVRLGGPRSPSERLHVIGNRQGAGTIGVIAVADGKALTPVRSRHDNDGFEFEFALPAELAGKRMIEVVLEVDQTFRPGGGDERDLGLSFGVIEIR